MVSFESISDTTYGCGECPIWDSSNGRLLWVDLSSGSLYEYNPAGGAVEKIAQSVHISGFSLHELGLICAGNQGIYFFNVPKGFQLISGVFNGEPLVCNDVIADVEGRFLFGTIYYTLENCNKDYPRGKLSVSACDGSINILDDGFHHVNGLGFSPDNKTLYFTDSVLRVLCV